MNTCRLRNTLLALLLFVGVGAMASCSSSTSTSTTIPQPSPPLPGDVNPIPFRFEELAALGNVQLAVINVTGNTPKVDDAAARTVEVTIALRNGALTDLQIRPESFRLYTSDLRGISPVNNPFPDPYKSDTRHTVTLAFPVGANLLGVALVFNSDGYGDRVKSGQFLLDPNVAFQSS